MTDYVKFTNFTVKDSLPTGDTNKVIRGAEFDTEFDAIATAVATKSNIAGPTFTGTATFDGLTATGTVDFSSATVSNLGSVTTVDINGGTIDGAVIGGSTPAAISGTTGTFSGAVSGTTGTFSGAVTGSNLNISNWDTAFGWGDHSTEGYLTSVTFSDMDAGAITTSGETFANSDTQIPTNAAVRNWVLTTYPTIVELNDLTANVTWATVPDAYISESSVTQHVTIEKATQSKTYTSGETSTLTLSESITSGVPVVSVTKEVAQTGITNNNWDVAADGTNYDLEDSAYATTLTPSAADADGTFTLGSGSFASDDVGKIVSGNGGTAIVLNTDGDYNLLTDFDDTSAIASGSWTLKEMVVDGGDTGFALASGTETVGGFVSSLASAYYTNKSFDYSAQETSVSSLTLNNDGTKMYVVGSGSDALYQYSLSTAYDVSTSSYDSVSLSVSSQGTSPVSVKFNTDGTKMFVLDQQGYKVNQYSLSTGFDLSTASYDSVFFSVASEITSNPSGVAFNSTGTKMYAVGATAVVYQYSLSSAFDLSTASYDSVSFSVSSQDSNPYEIVFNADATRFYITGNITDTVYEYLLGTASDVSSAFYSGVSLSVTSQASNPTGLAISNSDNNLYVSGFTTDKVFQYSLDPTYNLNALEYTGKSFSVTSQDTSPREVAFNTDGTKMYVLGISTDSIYQYSLTTGFDVSTASYDSVSFDVSSQDTSPSGLTFNNDGTKMYVIGYGTDAVYEYDLSTGFDLSTASYDSVSFSVASQATQPHQAIFNDDGTKMYVIGATSARIYQYSLSTAFDLSTASYDSVSLSVSARDGQGRSIAFNNDGTTLFFFGNANDNVHQYSLSTAYDLSTATYLSITLSVSSEEGNGEGIVFNNDGSKMFLVGTVNDKVYEYSIHNIKNAQYADKSLSVGSQETLPFTLAFNNDGTKLYVTGQGTDTVYEYDLSTPYDVSTGTYNSNNFSVSSQCTEPWSLFFKTDGTKMYVLDGNSDTGFQYTLSTAWDITTASYDSVSFNFGSQDSAPRGFTFKPDGTKLYMTGYLGDYVNQYTLSTAWDLSTTSYDGVRFHVAGQDTFPYSVRFNSDGSRMFIVGDQNHTIYQYTLSTPWSVSTASYDSVLFDLKTQDTNTVDFVFANDKLYTVGYTNDKVYQYNLGDAIVQTPVVYSSDYAVAVTNSTGQVDSTYFTDINSTTTTESVGTGEAYYAYSVDDHVTWKIIHNTDGERSIVRNNSGTWEYNSNGTYGSETWTSATTNSEVGALKQAMTGASTTTGQFDVSNASYSQSFSVSSQDTAPFGIGFNNDGTKMFIVGNAGDDVNEYTLSTAYDISTASYSQNFSVATEDTTPKGVVFNGDGTKMFIVGGTGNDILEYALSTGFDVSTASYSQNFSIATEDSVPSRIAFNNDGTKMFFLGNAGDDVNEYDLSTGFDISTASYSQNFSINAQSPAAQGIAFNLDGTKMFIADWSNDVVNEYTLSTAFDVSTLSYSQNFSIAGQETGPRDITFNSDGSKMFITGDSGSVYEYNVSSTSYPNQMTGTQFDAVTDANHLTLSTTMDFMIALKNADSTSTSPTSDGVAFNYDAESLQQGAVLGTDYNWDFPALNKVRITSLAAQNLKVRVI